MAIFKRAVPARSPLRGRRLLDALESGSRRIREHLDTDAVLRASVDVLHQALGSMRTSGWITSGDTPRLAYAQGEGIENQDAQPPLAVTDAAARARRSLNQLVGGLALPIVTPRLGMLGVLYLERTSVLRGIEGFVPDEMSFVESIAHETGLALQAASLYERAVAEKIKSEAILARVADAVVVTDARGEILQWNQAAARIFARPEEDAVGRRCDAVLGLRRDGAVVDCSEGCPLLATAEIRGGLGEDVWRTHEDGRQQPLLASAEAVLDQAGAVSEIVHSYRDVTRLKEAEEAKTLFLATASHELKTPLTVIQGFAQTLLHRDASPEMQKDALRLIERRAVELDAIVNRLLLSSKVEGGGPELELGEVDVAPLLKERVDAFNGATERTIELRVPSDMPLAIADGSAVAVVVDHLIDNAMKYSPADRGVMVAVTVSEAIDISFTDRGIGMDAEQVAHCFDKFWQAESSSTRRFKGTGIGLYIVRSLVRAMGGSITVRSALGEGSTFVVSLARADIAAPPPSPPAPPARRPEPGVGERSVIKEFMRQIGVPVRREP